MLSDAVDIIYNKLNDWLQTSISMLPNFVVAALVVTFFFIVAKYVKNF